MLGAILSWQCNPCTDCKSAQQCTTTGHPLPFPHLHLGPCSSVGMRRGTYRQTDTQMAVTNIHFALAMPHANCKAYLSLPLSGQAPLACYTQTSLSTTDIWAFSTVQTQITTSTLITIFQVDLDQPILTQHVQQENLWRDPCCHPTSTDKTLKETPSTEPNQWSEHHPFFIHHRTQNGKAISLFRLTNASTKVFQNRHTPLCLVNTFFCRWRLGFFDTAQFTKNLIYNTYAHTLLRHACRQTYTHHTKYTQ